MPFLQAKGDILKKINCKNNVFNRCYSFLHPAIYPIICPAILSQDKISK